MEKEVSLHQHFHTSIRSRIMWKQRTRFFFCLTFVPYTLCSLLLLLPFDAVIVRVFLITLFLVLSVSYSHYLFWSCFLLLFVFSLLSLAHKSYRVSVTVATVKRTNSVQEYLTTVFITIQFSLSLLVIVRSVCWLCVSQCSTFSTLPLSLSLLSSSRPLFHTHLFQQFVLFVPVFCCCCLRQLRHFEPSSSMQKIASLLFIMHFLHSITHRKRDRSFFMTFSSIVR